MSLRKRKFSFEYLESRELMAGNVQAFLSGGDLYIVEQVGQYNAANGVTVQQLSNGQVRVNGAYAPDGGFSNVNGKTFADFTVPGHIRVELAGGHDSLGVYGGTYNEMHINMSAAGATADSDSVYLGNVTTRGLTNINTGNGNDVVTMRNVNIGDGYDFDNLNIRTGAGADQVFLGDAYNQFGTVRSHLNVYTNEGSYDLDADTVSIFNAVAYQNVNVFTGGGADTLTMKQVTAGNDVLISTEGGADKVTLDSVQAIDDFWTYLGDGDDTLQTMYLRADQMHLDGGTGTDRLSESVLGYWNAKSTVSFEPQMFFYYGFTSTSGMTMAGR